MSGQPWAPEHDDILRAALAAGLSDWDIRGALKPIRPSITEQGVRQRRYLLKLFRRRGGPRDHARPSGPQSRCLGCDRPFRSKHKHNRLCPRCTEKAKDIAA